MDISVFLKLPPGSFYIFGLASEKFFAFSF